MHPLDEYIKRGFQRGNQTQKGKYCVMEAVNHCRTGVWRSHRSAKPTHF